MKLQNETVIVTEAAAGMEDILRSTIQKFDRRAIDGGLRI
jgi:hypothetical protein